MLPSAGADTSAGVCELATFQREILRAITGGGCTNAVVDAIDSARGIAATERLGVYRRNYELRLAHEVEREYPATRALLGSTGFSAVASKFTDAHTSHAFTLDGYARAFPEFLPRATAIESAILRAAARDLARLERAIALCRAARDLGATQAVEATARPRNRRVPVTGGSSRLRRALGAVLIGFAHDVEVGYVSWCVRRSVAPLEARATTLVLFRCGVRVERLRVARREAPLLRALLCDARLDAAVEIAQRAGLGAPAIGRALERWVAAGLLAL